MPGCSSGSIAIASSPTSGLSGGGVASRYPRPPTPPGRVPDCRLIPLQSPWLQALPRP